MPKVRVDILKGKTQERKKRILDIIHDALVASIGIPEDDRMQILCEHEVENFCMPNVTSNEYMNIDITLYPGRKLAAKQLLFETLLMEFGKLGIAKSEVMITLHEPEINNWSS